MTRVDYSLAEPWKPPKQKQLRIHPNLCLKCGSNSYDAVRLELCRMCGAKLKLPAGWELHGSDPYGYHRP